ncbi:MAG: hypothetical protein AAF915_29120 [Cyanobacteria bacterium P01_D01_bin.50]
MTTGNVKQQILEHIEVLPSEKVKTLLLTWLTNSSGNLEDFEQLLANQPSSVMENTFEYGEIDGDLNFQPLSEAQMVQQSKLALEEYHRQGSGVAHDTVCKWADSLGTNEES